MTRRIPPEKKEKVLAKARNLIRYGFSRWGAVLACLDYYQANANREETAKKLVKQWESQT